MHFFLMPNTEHIWHRHFSSTSSSSAHSQTNGCLHYVSIETTVIEHIQGSRLIEIKSCPEISENENHVIIEWYGVHIPTCHKSTVFTELLNLHNRTVEFPCSRNVVTLVPVRNLTWYRLKKKTNPIDIYCVLIIHRLSGSYGTVTT